MKFTSVRPSNMLYVWCEGRIVASAFGYVEAMQAVSNHIMLAKILWGKTLTLGDFQIKK